MLEKMKGWLNYIYKELTGQNEPVEHVAFSFAVGVFIGIMPFMGVVVAIAVAFWFKLNKAAAVLGSALTNTWLGLLTIGLAGYLGSWITGTSWSTIEKDIALLKQDMSLSTIMSFNVWELLLSLAIGYVIISLGVALFGYVLAFIVIKWHRSYPR